MMERTVETNATLEDLRKHIQCLQVSDQEIEYIATIPQHNPNLSTNEKWLEARTIRFGNTKIKRITGSVFGSIIGVSPYTTPQAQVLEFIHPTFFGNAACLYGNRMEQTCQDMFLEYQYTRIIDHEKSQNGQYELIDTKIENPGLCIFKNKPWYGMSPDAILLETWRDVRSPVLKDGFRKKHLCEYKCPYKQRNLKLDDSTYRKNLYNANTVKLTDEYLCCPSYYYAQVQLGMHLLAEQFLDCPDRTQLESYFVVYAPASNTLDGPLCFDVRQNYEKNSQLCSSHRGTIQITKLKYNQQYMSHAMEASNDWYFNCYLPELHRSITGAPPDQMCVDTDALIESVF